jgi:nitroreductase
VNPSRVVNEEGAPLAALSAWRRFAASHKNVKANTPTPIAVRVVMAVANTGQYPTSSNHSQSTRNVVVEGRTKNARKRTTRRMVLGATVVS